MSSADGGVKESAFCVKEFHVGGNQGGRRVYKTRQSESSPPFRLSKPRPKYPNAKHADFLMKLLAIFKT